MTTERVLDAMTTPELLMLVAELDRLVREAYAAGRPHADTLRLRATVDDLLYARGA